MLRYLLILLFLPWPAQALDAAATGADAANAESHFAILEFVVEGNSVLPVSDIEAAVYPHLGERKAIADVESARLALEKAYHQAGYLTVFVNIPEQKVDAGEVRLKVVQSEVERLKVSGSRYYTLGRIKANALELAEGKVPYFPDVQKQLAALSRTADRKITPVLRPGREPGKVEVELKVADHAPLHGTVELNDRYSADTSRTRLSGGIHWDNLWQREHSLGVSYQVAPENTNDSKALSATYSVPLASGNYLAAYAVKTESEVASLGTLGVIGNGTIAGLRYILPLRARAGLNQSLTLGVDYKNFSQTVNLLGADSFNTPISYLPFMAAWDGSWGDETGGQTKLNLTANFHLRDLVGAESEFSNKRFKSSSGYFFLRGSVDQTWRWPSGTSLKFRSGFQLTDLPLVSNEQFAIGGVDTVRGYFESETLGDYGLHAGLEWQSAHTAHPPYFNDLYAIAFIEGGYVAIHDSLPSQIESSSLAGAGLGLRADGLKGFKLALDLAWPLRDGGRTLANDKRVHFNLGYAF